MSPKKPKKPKAPKAPKGAKKAKKKSTIVLKLVMAVLGAAVATAIALGLALVFGVAGALPSLTISQVGITIDPLGIAAVLLFAVFLVVGVIYVFFQKQVVKSSKQTVETFRKLPAIGKGLVVGIPFGVVVGLTSLLVVISVQGSSLASVQQGSITAIALMATAAVAWLVFSLFVFQHLRREQPLAQGVKIALVAIATGMVLTIAMGFLDNTVLGSQLPWYSYLAVLGVAVPVTLLLLAPEYYNERGWVLSEFSRKSGFAQQRQIQGVTIAAAVGFVVALLLATIVNLIFAGLLIPVLAFLLFWAAGTVGALQWFKQRSDARLDLVITDVRNRSTGDRRRELAIRNEGNKQVDLRDAKIRDTEGDLFRTSLDVVLAPGQTTRFDIPPAFALATTQDDVSVGGWSISRSNPVPVIVTREGVKYELWMEEERHQRVREHGNTIEGSGLNVNVERGKSADDDGGKGRGRSRSRSRRRRRD